MHASGKRELNKSERTKGGGVFAVGYLTFLLIKVYNTHNRTHEEFFIYEK